MNNIHKLDITNPDKKLINIAVKTLLEGGLVVYPTDTAYGLGANAFDKGAVAKVYEIMNRELIKPTHVIVKDWEMINDLTIVNKSSKKLFNKFLPGPLTIVLLKKDNTKLSTNLTGDFKTLGVRIPNSSVTKLISKYANVPYTTSSANRTGEKTPYSVVKVSKVLDISKVDVVLDAGVLPIEKPSTLVDLSENGIDILREGPVTKEDILKTLSSKSK